MFQYFDRFTQWSKPDYNENMPIPTDCRFVPLFVTHRFDTIKIRGYLGGIETEEDADGGEV